MNNHPLSFLHVLQEKVSCQVDSDGWAFIVLNALIYEDLYKQVSKGGSWRTTGSRALPKLKIHKSGLKIPRFH